ncbi:Protein kinase superfamily protein [Klebsormidium nitens]|uniref:Protein kinase superfamily protein n=1 Tax=Klebsormidium nitens TaxID=105231 RepID=A0A1Y1ICE2_KLENI|nr:Protein kinase superfamily protein [Klebsormidium nitens]|eukprot:GAQ86741.1 Protein kinase superfamily protein [Klebsormidium nitens]
MGHRVASAWRDSLQQEWTMKALLVIVFALLMSGASANVNMTVYLNSAKVTPPLSGTPLAQGSIHLSFPENVDPLTSTSPLPIFFDKLQLDDSITQPITGIRLFAGAANTASARVVVDFGVSSLLPVSGSVQVAPSVFRSILADPANFYITVYNEDYPDAGILRGQLPTLVAKVMLDSANELPAINTPANGSAIITFADDAVCLSDLNLQTPDGYILSGAHLHFGEATQVGPVTVFFPITNDPTQPACTAVDSKAVQGILGNMSEYYINIHDLNNVNYGLVRNQLNTAVARVGLQGTEEVPTIAGDGNGQVMINVLGTNTVCFWRLSTSGLQSPPAGLTINSGSAGQNGPTLVTFSSGGQPKFPTGGCVVVPNVEVIYQILNPGGNRYVNLLTNDYASGAARGQLVGQGQVSQSLLLRQNTPPAPVGSPSSDSNKTTIIIIVVVLCVVALLFVAACAAFCLWRRSKSAKPKDHTALARKWFDWNPNQEVLPTAAPPSIHSSKSPPQSVVISMPEGTSNVGHVRASKESGMSSRSSERSSGELHYADKTASSDRSTSHDRAQTSGGLTGTHGGKTVSSTSTVGSAMPFAGETVTSRSFTLREILVATDYFNENGALGGGGFGKVYKGLLDDGSLIAVKRMKKESKQGMREFINEVRLLGRLKHPNLVRLIGFCATDEEQLLCYEYMPNGNLAQHLRGPHKPLSWRMRLEVAIGAAKGLDHLHVIATPPVIHRDIKSSNILLDEDWNAKVADFGLSKAALTNASQPASSTFVRGTPGYFDPEYYEGQRLTEKSDVYAFGVVLLEMLTGKKPIDQTLPSADGSLAKWARPHLRDPDRTLAIVDPRIQGSMTRASVLKIAALAYQCISLQGEERPSMSAVVLRLHDANSS